MSIVLALVVKLNLNNLLFQSSINLFVTETKESDQAGEIESGSSTSNSGAGETVRNIQPTRPQHPSRGLILEPFPIDASDRCPLTRFVAFFI